MTTPLDPHHDRDFRQLTGAFDRPIAPSPRFAESLKARLEREATNPPSVTVPSPPVSHRTARRASTSTVPRRRGLDMALAAALIVTMLGGSLWYADVRIGGNDESPTKTARYAAQPLTTSPTPVIGMSESGDPGYTRNYQAGFDPAEEHAVRHLGDESLAGVQQAAVSGDILVVSADYIGWAETGAPGLTGIDLSTGEVIWRSETVPRGEFVMVDGTIYGAFRLAPETATPESGEFRMMAIDAATGDPKWGGPELLGPRNGLSNDAHTAQLRPTIINDMLYYIDRDGAVVALNAKTGAQEWSVPLERDSVPQGSGWGASVVGNRDALYAANSQNVILKLNPATGEEIDRFPLLDRPAGAFAVQLHLRKDTLIVIARTADLEPKTSFVDAVSTTNGKVVWSHRLGTVSAFVTLTDDVVALPHYVAESEVENVEGDLSDAGRYTSFFNLESGEPVALYGPSDAAFATVSSSGSVVCIDESTAIHCVDTASADRTLVTLPYAPGDESFTPLLFWNETAILLDVKGDIVLIQPTAP